MTSDTDLKLLGKRRAYQLGRLRAVRPAPAGPRPCPLPRAGRRGYRGPAALWLLALAAGAAGIAAGVNAGLWLSPFAVGLIAGPLSWIGGWRARSAVPAAALLAAAGAAVPALRAVTAVPAAGLAAEAAAAGRAVTALSGAPATVAGVVAVMAVAAVFEMLGGLWLGRLLARLAPVAADWLLAGLEDGGRAPGDGPPGG